MNKQEKQEIDSAFKLEDKFRKDTISRRPKAFVSYLTKRGLLKASDEMRSLLWEVWSDGFNFAIFEQGTLLMDSPTRKAFSKMLKEELIRLDDTKARRKQQ